METPNRDVSQKMVDWVIAELRFKAKIFQKTSAIAIFNADVVKSDTAISVDLRESLKAAVRSLEDVPDIYKDYHPGSDGKVLDLVHPSLFPLIYGRSRVLEDSLIGIHDCTQSCGKGSIISIRPVEDCLLNRKGRSRDKGSRMREETSEMTAAYSLNFQVDESFCMVLK